MLSSNPICPVCNYATSAVYCDLPTPEQLANGVKPLDSLPAAWWNKMWNMINCSVNQARGAVGSFITELNNVLAGAGICPNCVCTDQLYQAIDRIRQTIGNATVAGAVKSSTTPGMVSIDENGFMTANCVGNATQLATSARTLVGAVNELKTTYDTCFGNVSTTLDGKAPTSHASSATTYGVGTAANYGHLRISDTYTSNLSDTGMAASQTALYCVYKYAEQIASSATGLGNTVGCSLGTAAAGTAATAARSDHVHPLPKCVCYADWAICARCVCHVACANARLYHVSLSPLASNNMSYVYVSCACPLTYCNTTGTLTAAQFCGNVCGLAACASRNGSGVAFGTAATYDAASFFHFLNDDIDSDNFTPAMNTQGSHRDSAHDPGWAGSLYTFYTPASQSGLMFRIIGGSGSDRVQMNYAIDGNRFGMCWATIINSQNIASQSVANATCAVNAAYATQADRAVNATYAACACALCNRPTDTQECSGICNLYFYSGCTRGCGYGMCCFTSYISGRDGYYYGNVCGTATCAITAGLCRCDCCVYAYSLCTPAGTCVALIDLYVENYHHVPVIITNPIWSHCGYRECIFSPPDNCGCISSLAMGNALIQVDRDSTGTLTRCHIGSYMVCLRSNSIGSCDMCWCIPYRMLGYANK